MLSADWFTRQLETQLKNPDSVQLSAGSSEQKCSVAMSDEQLVGEDEQEPELQASSEEDDEEDRDDTPPQLSKNEKDYDKTVASKLTQDIKGRLSQGVYGTDPARAAPVCEIIRTQLAPPLPRGPGAG